MPSRRGGRWVFWPARILWFPTLAVGLWLLAGVGIDTARVDGDTWRVLLSVAAPDAWFQPVWRGVVGLAVVLAGLGLTFAYSWEPGPYRAATAVQYRPFSWAAGVLLLLAFFATYSLAGHVVEFGAGGMDWRFLATLRSHWLDRLLTGLAVAGAAGTYLASWGLVPTGWAREEGAGIAPADPADPGTD